MSAVGENRIRVAEEVREHPKERFRPFFVALHGAAKRWPGGITELAHHTGRNPKMLADRLNPNLLDKMPSAEELLLTLELVQSSSALNALALLAGRVTVPVQVSDRAPREVVSCFLSLVERISAVMGRAAPAVSDGRVDASERAELLPLLDELLASAVEFQAVVRGG